MAGREVCQISWVMNEYNYCPQISLRIISFDTGWMVRRLGFLNPRTQEMLDNFSYLFFFSIWFYRKRFLSIFVLYSWLVPNLYLVHVSNSVSQRKLCEAPNTEYLPGSVLYDVFIDILYLRGENVCLLHKDKCILHTMGNSQLCIFFSSPVTLNILILWYSKSGL